MATYLDTSPWGNVLFNGQLNGTDSIRNKYFGSDGKLRDGYESRFLGNGDNASGNGALATYTNAFDDMGDSYDPQRDRSNYGIFQAGSTAASTTQDPFVPNRATGEYKDIIASLRLDQQAAADQAAKYAAQQAQQYQTQTNQLTASFENQISQLNQANAANINSLNSRYDEQTAQFNEFQTLAADQLATAEANYQEQQRMVGNLQSAFVPEANPSAFAAAIGDQRSDGSRPKTSNRLSDLSSLSIVSGLGTASNPLSGLQLA